MGNITEEAGKVGTTALSVMAPQPLAVALLIVNICFLGFAGYVLGQVAGNAAERNKTQMELIAKLVEDVRGCRGGAQPQRVSLLPLPPLPPLPSLNGTTSKW